MQIFGSPLKTTVPEFRMMRLEKHISKKHPKSTWKLKNMGIGNCSQWRKQVNSSWIKFAKYKKRKQQKDQAELEKKSWERRKIEGGRNYIYSEILLSNTWE